MSAALDDLGGRLSAPPALSLSQSRALADLLDQGRRMAAICCMRLDEVLLHRPMRVHITTMQALTHAGLIAEVPLRAARSGKPGTRWRFTVAGLRVARGACPAAGVGAS